MEPKIRALARAVACLAVALIPLGAAPIHHANYRSEATLISAPVSCGVTVGFDSHGEPHHAGFGCSQALGGRGPYFGTIGIFSYDDFPDILLPAGSRVLKADLNQWGYFEVEKVSDAVSVTPIDNTQPYYAENTEYEIRMSSGVDYMSELPDSLGSGCNTIVSVVYSGPIQCDFGSGTDWTERVRLGYPVPNVRWVALHIFGVPDVSPLLAGANSWVTASAEFRLINSAAFLDLDITYESAVPEPATASLFLAGAISLLFIRRTFRTHQP